MKCIGRYSNRRLSMTGTAHCRFDAKYTVNEQPACAYHLVPIVQDICVETRSPVTVVLLRMPAERAS